MHIIRWSRRLGTLSGRKRTVLVLMPWLVAPPIVGDLLLLRILEDGDFPLPILFS